MGMQHVDLKTTDSTMQKKYGLIWCLFIHWIYTPENWHLTCQEFFFQRKASSEATPVF